MIIYHLKYNKMDIDLFINYLKQTFNFYVFLSSEIFTKLQKKNPTFYKKSDAILGCPDFRDSRLLVKLKNQNIDETVNDMLNYKKEKNHYITLKELEKSSISTLFSDNQTKDREKFITNLLKGISTLESGYLGIGCIYMDLENVVHENFNFLKKAIPIFKIDYGDGLWHTIYEFYLVVNKKNQDVSCKPSSPITDTVFESLNPVLVCYKPKSRRSKKIKKSKKSFTAFSQKKAVPKTLR